MNCTKNCKSWIILLCYVSSQICKIDSINLNKLQVKNLKLLLEAVIYNPKII